MPEPEVCPYCKSAKVALIRYGRPRYDETLKPILEGGKVILGECAAMPENRFCLECEKVWRSEIPFVIEE